MIPDYNKEYRVNFTVSRRVKLAIKLNPKVFHFPLWNCKNALKIAAASNEDKSAAPNDINKFWRAMFLYYLPSK